MPKVGFVARLYWINNGFKQLEENRRASKKLQASRFRLPEFT